MRRIAMKCLIVIISLAVSVVLIEWVLKAIDFEPNPLEIDVGNLNDARFFHIFEDRHFVYDPQLIWRPKAGYEVFNSKGFRGPEIPAVKQPGSYRMFAVGDSNTLGWGKEEDAHWPGYLQEFLKKKSDRFLVMNAAVYGYSSYQGLLRLKECLDYNPDLFLISFGANDAHLVRVSDQELIQSGIANRQMRRALHRFRLGKLLLLVLGRLTAPRAAVQKPRVSVEEYRENLMEMIRISREHRISIVLLTRPYNGAIADKSNWKYFAHLYNEATVEIAEREDVVLVDIYTYFKYQDQFFADEAHLNPEGLKLQARIILDTIQPMLPRK